MKLSQAQILGIIRHILTFGGGLLVTKGLLNDAMAAEIIGGLVTLVGVIWSYVSKTPLPTDFIKNPTETKKP